MLFLNAGQMDFPWDFDSLDVGKAAPVRVVLCGVASSAHNNPLARRTHGVIARETLQYA